MMQDVLRRFAAPPSRNRQAAAYIIKMRKRTLPILPKLAVHHPATSRATGRRLSYYR